MRSISVNRSSIRFSQGFRLTLVLIGVTLLYGCATPVELQVQTPSGKPEVTIVRSDVGAVKAHFLNLSINDGYSVEKDSEFMLELSRPVSGMENFAASMVAGNAYTTNTRVVTYTFARVDEKTRVIVSNAVRAVFPNGRVNTVQLNDNNQLANNYQTMLEQAKRNLEARAIQAPSN